MHSFRQEVTHSQLKAANFFEVVFAAVAILSIPGALAISEYIPKDQGLLTKVAAYGLGGLLAAVIYFCGQGYFQSLRVQKLPIKRT